MGAGIKSHPKQVNKMIENLTKAGVEIEYRSGAMAYQSNVMPNRAGRFIIDEEASYGAWLHEYRHFIDDKNDGYLGMRVFADPNKCAQREKNAYELEIRIAKSYNDDEIIDRLTVLMENEVKKYE